MLKCLTLYPTFLPTFTGLDLLSDEQCYGRGFYPPFLPTFTGPNLLSDEECYGRGSISILIAFSIGNLFQKFHFFFAGHEDDFVITEDHDCIS